MPPKFSFRLNGTVVPMIFINRERVGGKLTGRRHIAVWIDGVGRFTIDDDEQLWEMTFPKYVLEYRNKSSWIIAGRTRWRWSGWWTSSASTQRI
jgi:hypothetical protein